MQDSKINIRYAVEADAFTIASVHITSWQKIYRGHIPDAILDKLSIEKRTQMWRDLIGKGIKVLVLENEKKIIGFTSICPSRDSDSRLKQCGEISAIYLHPDFWHQGLGKKLCSSALGELKSGGYSEVILWVLKENMQARQFYESMGFMLDENEKIDNLNACTLGVIVGEEATENVNIPVHEVRYYKSLKWRSTY